MSLDPPENCRNIVFPCNAGHGEESQSCQLSIQCWAIIGLPANSMAFRWWPDVIVLTVSPIKKVKNWTPLPKHHASTSIEA